MATLPGEMNLFHGQSAPWANTNCQPGSKRLESLMMPRWPERPAYGLTEDIERNSRASVYWWMSVDYPDGTHNYPDSEDEEALVEKVSQR